MAKLKELSVHPYIKDLFIPDGATKLIIGTIPPQRFCINHRSLLECDVDFYYGSFDNHFWKMMSCITNTKLVFNNTEEAKKQRKKILVDLKIGITDIVASCVHKGGRSDDASLEKIEYSPLKELLEENTEIKKLLYTSEFVKKLINDYNKKNSCRSYHDVIDSKQRAYRADIINNKDRLFDVTILYSPSPRGLGAEKIKAFQDQYIKAFGKD